MPISVNFCVDAQASIAGFMSGRLNASAGFHFVAKHGFKFDMRTGMVPINEVTTLYVPPSLSASVTFAAGSIRLELLPGIIFDFLSTSLITYFPLRLQADVNFIAPDAVLCQLPVCSSSSGVPFYATWQVRLRITLTELRLRNILSRLGGDSFAGIVSMVVSDFQLWPEKDLLNIPLTYRRRLASACVVPEFAAVRIQLGRGRALQEYPWHNERPSLHLSQLTERPTAITSALMPSFTGSPTQFSTTASSLLWGWGKRLTPQGYANDMKHLSRSLLTSENCGTYNGVGGSWSGSDCSCTNTCCYFDCNCESSWTLSCKAGYMSASVGIKKTCFSLREGGLFTTGAFKSTWNDDGLFCGECLAGSYASTENSRNCTQCAPGTYAATTKSITCSVCPFGSYCPSGSVTPIVCTGTAYCPEGSSSPGSASPSLTPTSSPTATITSSSSESGTQTPSITTSPSETGTPSETSTTTPSCTPTSSESETKTMSSSSTQSYSTSESNSPTTSVTLGASISSTPSNTVSPSVTASISSTASSTASPTPSRTPSSSMSVTVTSSKTGTRSSTTSVSPTSQPTPSHTSTPLPLSVGSFSYTEGLHAVILSKLVYAGPDALSAWMATPSVACSICPLCMQLGLAKKVVTTADATLGVAAFMFQPMQPSIYDAAISFRGTDTSEANNIMLDLLTLLVPYAGCASCQVHLGFLTAYAALASSMYSAVQSSGLVAPARLLVTGHSLGGAIATLAAFELALLGFDVHLVTFGSPRVGNGVFAAAMTSAVTTHTGSLFGSTLPLSSSPLRRRRELVADEFSRPSILLIEAARRACGSDCSGLVNDAPDAEIAFAWENHVSGIATRAARGLAVTTRPLLSLWRIVNAWDPVPTMPLPVQGYVHVPTEIFFTGSVESNQGLNSASSRLVAPALLGDYSTIDPTSPYDAGRPPMGDSNHHALEQYAYRLVDSVFLGGLGSASIGFWGGGPTVDISARALGTTAGGGVKGLPSYQCPQTEKFIPSMTPSAAPSCNYALIADPPLFVPVSATGATRYRAVRTLTSFVSTTLALKVSATADTSALVAAVVWAASVYAGSVPSNNVKSRRLVSSDSLQMSLEWEYSLQVLSDPMNQPNVTLLTDSDLAAFDDAEFFIGLEANYTVQRVRDMMSGSNSPKMNCSGVPDEATALGCGSNTTTASFTFANAVQLQANISHVEAAALNPTILAASTFVSVSELQYEPIYPSSNSTGASTANETEKIVGSVVGVVAFFSIVAVLFWYRCVRMRRARAKVNPADIPATKVAAILTAPAEDLHSQLQAHNHEHSRVVITRAQAEIVKAEAQACEVMPSKDQACMDNSLTYFDSLDAFVQHTQPDS